MVKHEQELLQKQQLFQMSQYQQQQQQQQQVQQQQQQQQQQPQHQMMQRSTTPVMMHPVYYTNNGASSQHSQQLPQSQASAFTHNSSIGGSGGFNASSNSSLNSAGHDSNQLLSLQSNNGNINSTSQLQQHQYQNMYQHQQPTFPLSQSNQTNRIFSSNSTSANTTNYQYSNNNNLQQAYHPAVPVHSIDRMQHYKQLHNLQQLQMLQVKLQAQTQNLSHNIQPSTALQPLNIRTGEDSFSTFKEHNTHEQQLLSNPNNGRDQDHDQQQQQLTHDGVPHESHHSYQCHLCEKQFRRKSWLKRHLLSHSNVKKFHCPWCSSTHKRKDNLLQHLKLKHTQYLLHEFTLFGILMNVNNGSGNTANLVTTSTGETICLINNEPSTTIRDMLDSNALPKDQVKRCLNYIVDSKCS